MSLAPSLPVPRSRFNTLPLAIGLFCVLWSYAFVAGKIGVTHCPPLILLAARFSLAGILIIGATLIRGGAGSILRANRSASAESRTAGCIAGAEDDRFSRGGGEFPVQL